jgi:hypothetical protein
MASRGSSQRRRSFSPPKATRVRPSRKSLPRLAVSAETVQGQGPKAALMIAAVEYVAFRVSGEENVFNLDVGRRMLAVDDCIAAADALAAMHAEVFERIAHLALALIGLPPPTRGGSVPDGDARERQSTNTTNPQCLS